MNKSIYLNRIEQQFYRLLLAALLKNSDPFWKKINVSRVKMTSDLQQCRIYFTTITHLSKEQAMTNIKAKSYALTKQLSHKWKLAKFPKLIFIYDQTLLDAETIQKFFPNDSNSDDSEN